MPSFRGSAAPRWRLMLAFARTRTSASCGDMKKITMATSRTRPTWARLMRIAAGCSCCRWGRAATGRRA
eukprot:524468-Alexandrium_andersonii.AAC.1